MAQVVEWIEKIENNPIMQIIIQIGIALVIMVLLIIVGNWIINIIFKENKKDISEEEKRRIVTLNRISKMFLKVIIIAFTVIEILSLFVDVKALLTVAGVGTIAIGIGAKAIVEDILSGFMILVENMFCVGDYILVADKHYGRVEKIGLRMTSIRQLDDSLFIIHNGEITKMTNYSKGTVRAAVLIGIAFEEDLDKTFEVLNHLFEKEMDKEDHLFVNKPQILGVDEFEDSAVLLRIEADVKAEDKRKVERRLRKQIKETLDEHHIEIPYNKCVILPDAIDNGEK